MAYEVYLNGLKLPITPSKIETKIKGNNKTLNLINDGDINVLKLPGLTEISFTALLPNSRYPFSLYDTKPIVFLDEFEKLKTEKKPFQFVVIRTDYKNEILFHTDMMVSLEDYTIIEDAKNGLDLSVSIKLKQFKEYGTKILKLTEEEGTTVAVAETPRSTENAPKKKVYVVVKGDTLWNIAKKHLGKGERYVEIYQLNRDKIVNPNLIYPGQILKMPT
jgi:LysM repeat protein